MNVVLNIGGREALPVRAIPYVTSWNESPDSIVLALARSRYIHLDGLEILDRFALTAYQADEQGRYEEIPANQWAPVSVRLECSTKKSQADERAGYKGENWDNWRIGATLALPDNVFVWLDEFRRWYAATRPLVVKASDDDFKHEEMREKLLAKLHDPDGELTESEWAMLDAATPDYEREDDRLCLNPLLPAEIEGRLWRYEGGVSARTTLQHVEQVHLVEDANKAMPATGSAADDVLTALFDPVSPEALKTRFPGDWMTWAKRPKRHGLDKARQGVKKYNPYLAAIWWLGKCPTQGWAIDRVHRTLINFLPARSKNSKHLLTGDLE